MEAGAVVEATAVRSDTPVLETAGASLGQVIDELPAKIADIA